MRVLSPWFFTVYILLILNTYALEEHFCPFFVEIRNTPNGLFKSTGATMRMPEVMKCTIIDGDFTISMINDGNHTNEDFPVFKYLREITGALLVYSAKGLTNLNHIFPNLRIIGGQSLIFNYALVIYQNDELRFVGLDKLTIIRNGGVRITDNPKLCFARSINWKNILIGRIHDVIIDSSGSSAVFTDDAQEIQSCNDEHGCKVNDPEKCDRYNGKISCWNSTSCQSYCPYHKLSNNKIGPGCSKSTGEKCHSSCLGGCEIPNDPTSCYACQKFELNGRCVDKCPQNTYEYKETRCVTAERCHSFLSIKSELQKNRLSWKAFHGKCHHDCPDGFQEDPNNSHICVRCTGYCPRKCLGGNPINSIGEAMRFEKCSIIEGKLEISVQNNGQSAKAEEFTKAFGNIREITGSLLIRFSPTFTSLHMFKNLEIIHGNELVNDRYALSVMELENLRQLFSPEVEKQLQIKNGLVSFQNNGKLCYNRIMDFVSNIELDQNVTDNDISKFSNGEKAICEEVPLHVKIGYISLIGFRIEWKKFDTTDMDHRKFMGYLVYHKKVDRIDSKLQIDDDRSECGDSWKKEFLPVDTNDSVTEVAHLVENLDPNSIYAFYVQTKTVHHPGARNAISKIGFVKTPFNTPEMPRIKRYEALGPNKILLEWDPPVKANGIITHYTVMWNAKSVGNTGIDPCGNHHLTEERSSSLLSSTRSAASSSENTCPADKGCCKCNDANTSGQEKSVLSKFDENGGENDAGKTDLLIQQPQELEEATILANTSKARTLRSIAVAKQPQKPKELNEDIGSFPEILNENKTFGRANISTTRVILTGLFHYTEYYIQIIACQDITVPENYCSKQAASRIIRTHSIPENDIIDLNTIKVLPYIINGTEQEDSRIISWKFPENPNGAILGFRYKIWKKDHPQTNEKCIPKKDFLKNNGILELGLSNGIYSFQVRSVTSSGGSENVAVKELFEINVPGWLTWDRALYIFFGFIVIIAVVCYLAYWHYKRNFGKKVQDYINGTISANPDYFTHLDIYQIDEWELKREDIKLYDEIGRGTFGKVYLGEGKNVISKNGVKFGKCAVKTIPESSANAERLHFLIEASVMKQFNTAYIVKLYGVVSEGQPVLVVMEMMDQGNLRDYLRARRPNSEENVNNAPLPTMISYFKWASQIADGMAYLESLKFCHRDLAARNCMVAKDETVKIGDFGMARDIYYHEYYKPAGKRLMPVRWMAPESLRDGKFTVKSDIWSYGIVLYEMLTLGQQPYAGLGNDQVFNYIEVRRNILRKPVGCPDFWYDLMRVCWKYNSRERPSFYQVLLYLRSTIDNSFKEFPDVREEGMKVFEKSFVITNFDEIDDEDYDFTYDEEEEDARKHTMLKELERMGKDHLEYQKSSLIDSNENDGGEQNDGEENDEAEDAERFQILTLEDVPQTELLLEGPPLLTKKQMKERDKKRKKFNKRQEQLEKEWQKKEDEAENESKKYAETIGLKDSQQKAPLLKSESPSTQQPHATVRFNTDGNYKPMAPNSITPESQNRTPKKSSNPSATSEVAKEKSDYTEILPLTKS